MGGEEVDEFGFWKGEAKGAKSNTEFMIVQVAISIEIEEGELD